MKLFVVTEGHYSDYHLIGIFDNLLDAESVKKLFNSDNDIDEWELNKSAMDSYSDNGQGREWMSSKDLSPDGRLPYEVIMTFDGESVSKRTDITTYLYHKKSYDVPWQSYHFYEEKEFLDWDENIKSGRIAVYCLAEDEKHAVKIANEIRAQVIANNEWGLSWEEYLNKHRRQT